MYTRDNAVVEVAHVFHRYGPEYRRSHHLPVNRLRAMRAIEACRTADLGGHVDECGHCGTKLISYNSCRNRHCPKCQFLKKEQWIEAARKKDLLPVPYFHVVFTVPDDLNPLILRNQEVLYNLMFKAVSETLRELSADPKRLGAEIGFIAVLHTWGQNLMDHPHIHAIVTGGGLSPGGRTWKSSRANFFIHVKALSNLFRGKFLASLKAFWAQDKLIYPGAVSYLASPGAFNALLADLYKKNWVVYCKPPFKKTQDVLDYLGRYTHRIAISNHRIIKLDNDKVSFRWRDYADNNKSKIMTVDADEFIRRFLLHVLPDRFVKIRHYGILGNRCRKEKIEKARELLACAAPQQQEQTDAYRRDHPACALQRTAATMMTGDHINNRTRTSPSENTPVLRNDILLPRGPFSCIVMGERGFSVCPEGPLFTRTNLAPGSMPLLMPTPRPQR